MRLEFWLDLASNYTYLSVMRIEAEAARRGVAIAWRPFLLGPIFRELGWTTPLFVAQKEKGRYVWRDMERQCAKLGIPWRRPSAFPRDPLPAARIALLGAEAPWVGAFCRRVMTLNFAEDRDIAARQTLADVLEGLGLEAGPLLQAAEAPATRARLRAQTAEARARGVFGAPTFFVGAEMFWGNDRLDDALALAAATPRASG